LKKKFDIFDFVKFDNGPAQYWGIVTKSVEDGFTVVFAGLLNPVHYYYQNRWPGTQFLKVIAKASGNPANTNDERVSQTSQNPT